MENLLALNTVIKSILTMKDTISMTTVLANAGPAKESELKFKSEGKPLLSSNATQMNFL